MILETTAPTLRFDPVAHRYTLGNREFISVTTALKEAGLVDERWYDEASRDRGTYVHRALHLLDQGKLAEPAVEPAYAGYVLAYRQFRALTAPVWSHHEHAVYDEVYGYAGTMDRAGILQSNNTRVILDIKTGAVPPWVGAQLAAYRRCLPDAHRYMRVALHLRADGSFAVHECTDRTDEALFLAALRVAQWKRARR